MHKSLLASFFFSSVFLTGCASGISSSEKLACDAVFESWPKVDFYETRNFSYLYSTTGVSRLGDNSESSEILGQNSRMASAIRDGMQEGDDEELTQLVTKHSLSWTKASNDGANLLRSLIFTAKMGKTQLNDVQLNLLADASADIIDAGNAAIQMRTRCIKIGYQGQS